MKRGFTLVELLIVIIIIGILATLAVPIYEGIIWRSRYAEVYQMVGSLAKTEDIYYQEHGHYTQNDTGDCFAGNGVAAGSTKVQKDLGIDIPSSCFFIYLIYPSTTYPGITNIYFAQPGYAWSWLYVYTTKTWYSYDNGTNAGPGYKYFKPTS